ncbi:MAG TPA: winged helix DNA-binding domain-containing protein [Actinomycetota bacterium]|nr:winged helix DNA-binding domain-containing protein [Actinomycetota bacterium]
MRTARRVTVGERRARLVRRHHLGRDGLDVVAVAGDLAGLHSSDAASVYLSARARVRGFEVADLETALYVDRTLVRVLGMRRTMFVVPVDLAPIVHGACTRALARRERARTIAFLEGGGVTTDGARWLKRVESETLALLREKGEATAVELRREIPELQRQIPVGAGTKWEGTIGASTRVLFLLANDGKIVRTRPRGSWLSTQYRWAPVETWLGRGIDTMEAGPARAELVRRWLRSFGPGTLADVKWWTGWTVAQTKAALAAAGAVEVNVDGATGYVLEDDAAPVRAPRPRAALLPALDPTVMGWAERDWYLGEHRAALFDRNGNAGPTVWWGGKVVGGWAQRSKGAVVFRLLEDLGREGRSAVAAEAAEVERWLGDVRVIPRFRTPLEKELSP